MDSLITRHAEIRAQLDDVGPVTDEEGKRRFMALVAETMGEVHMQQADLARYVDVSAATVSRWLGGKSFPHRSQQRRILSVLKRRLSRQLTKERSRDALVRGMEKPAAVA